MEEVKAEMGARDVLAECITRWIEDADSPYKYADTLIAELYKAGWVIEKEGDWDGDVV